MTKRIFLIVTQLLLFCALQIGCKTQTPAPVRESVPKPAPAERMLSAEQQKQNVASFDVVWETVRDKHFDPKLNGVDWNAARTELRPKVEQAETMSEARAIIGALLERLEQTHFGIIPQSAYKDLAQGSTKNGDSGIDLRVIGGKGIVVRVEPNSGGMEAGVRPGYELLAVRGEPVAPMIEKLTDALASSTTKDIMLSRSLIGRLHDDVGKSVPATFLDGNGKRVEINVPMKAPGGQAAHFGNLPTFYVHYDAKKIEPNVGYIYLSAFFGGDVVNNFRDSIEKFQSTDGLIIDLRGNPGGIGAMAMGIGNLLVDRGNQQLGTMTMRNGKMNFVLNPQLITYSKPVAVLVDGCSGSTSEILAQGLRDIGRAHIIGSRTAGAALPSTVMTLPNGDGFQYAFANYTSSGGEVLEGKGVQPDDVVEPTREALLAGKDQALDAAVKWVQSQKK